MGGEDEGSTERDRNLPLSQHLRNEESNLLLIIVSLHIRPVLSSGFAWVQLVKFPLNHIEGFPLFVTNFLCEG